MRNGNSRTADKFVARLPDGMRDQVEQRSKTDHISMNSFVVQAIEEKLARAAGEPDLVSHLGERLAALERRMDDRAGLLS
jgi:hypothetical protein